MIRLTLPKEPYWLDMPQGARLRVRPCTTPLWEAARRSGYRRGLELSEHVAAVLAAGGDVDGLPDLSDEDQVAGVSQYLFVEALAHAAILEWEGVAAEDGEPIAATCEAISAYIAIPTFAEAFIGRYGASLAAVYAEGKGSRPARGGTSPAGQATARGAGKKTSPARAAAKA